MQLVDIGIIHLTSHDGRAKEAKELEKGKDTGENEPKQEILSRRVVWLRPTSPSIDHWLSQQCQTEEAEPFDLKYFFVYIIQ